MNHNGKWNQILNERVLPVFPRPWASHGADERFEKYIYDAIKRIDTLKHRKEEKVVYLGKPEVWIYDEKSLQDCRKNVTMHKEGKELDEVTGGLVNFFNGMVDWGHPKMGMNVMPPSTLVSIAAHTFASMFSPNLIEEEYCVNVAAAEIEAIAMSALLAGYDPLKASGIFTFGGLGTWLYAMKVGLTKALGKESRYKGIRQDAQILTSEASHFSKVITADWTGLGCDNIMEIPLNDDNSMNMDALYEAMEECHKKGLPIGLINCTTGTTDAFGVDDVGKAVEKRDAFLKKYNLPYKPHVHCDAVIGWAWACFREYDFQQNPLEFDETLKNDLREVALKFEHIHKADSIGFDFHKTGYAPYISSLFLLKDGSDFDLIKRPKGAEAYLFHFGAYNPGEYSIESSRTAGGALAAWANLTYFGIEGYQVILAQLVKMERLMREHINSHNDMIVINPEDHGFVTLYRVYPEGIDAKEMYRAEFQGQADEKLIEHNTYIYRLSQELFRRQREEQGPFLSFTTNHRTNRNGKPVAALKVFPMTPYADAAIIRDIADAIVTAKKNVDRERVRA